MFAKYRLCTKESVLCNSRQESGKCRACYAAAAAADVQVNGAEGRAKGYTQKCCNYSAMGKGTYGYDCLSIPNAEKATAGMKMNNRVCGSNVGLPLADNEALTADGKQTICSKLPKV